MTKENKKRIDDWVTEWYEWVRKEIGTNIAKHQMSQYADDLTIHMIESLYHLSDEKVEQMLRDGKIQFWILRGASLQLRSSSSPFWHIYRKHKFSARENGLSGSHSNIFDGVYEEYDDSLYQCFKESWGELNWYDRTLMEKHFYQKWSLEKLHKYYNISKSHLVKDINRSINQIRKKCQEC
jgi:hypothetical protein